MGAYEGLRSERTTSPIASVPTERMRRGDFGQISTQIVNPITKAAVPGQPDPALAALGRSGPAAAVLPAAEPAGDGERHRQQLSGTGADREQHRPAAAAGRPEHQQRGAPLRPLQLGGRVRRLRQRRPHHRPVPATRQQEHAGVLAADAVADAAQRLPDRLPPHRHRLAQQPDDRRRAVGRLRHRHPGLRRRRPLRQPGHPDDRPHRVLGTRQRRHQLVPVRHDVPDVQRAVLDQGHAQHPDRVRPAQDGDRPPRRQQPARPVQLQRRR